MALAAARRGWEVLLIEARDIASGTSTTSTKLIHGGVRYLESALRSLRYADWKLVREALRERAWMLASHPDLCRPLPIVLPVSRALQKAYYGLGLRLYDWVSYPHRLQPPSWVDGKQLRAVFPILQGGFIGGWRYWDGQFSDRLYAVHVALFLRQRYGVEVRTHQRVVQVVPQSRSVRIEIETQSGARYTEEADFFVNATGPWADELRRQIRPGVPPRLRVSRGSHLVLSGTLLPIREGFLVPKTDDGRVLFVLPWMEGTVLVGTTDEEASAPVWNAPVPEAEEAYLRSYLHRYFALEAGFPVQARFAGFRPLVAASAQKTARLARSHVVELWPAERTLHLLGGKWTTFRKMGEDALQAIARALGQNLPVGEPVVEVRPDAQELENWKSQYPTPIVEEEPYVEGEVLFWRSLGWAEVPEDLVEGRWQLHLIDEERARRLREALERRWSEWAYLPKSPSPRL